VDNFSLSGLLLSGYTPGPENRSFCSAAMNAESYTPCHRFPDFAGALQAHAGRPLIALEITPDAAHLPDFKWPPEGILAVGNESLGIPQDLIKCADFCLKIPVFGRKHSLNVSSALAIALYELRQYHELGARSKGAQ
jgi:tRNA G18 (ribose-2'-O)-methylase SpoU